MPIEITPSSSDPALAAYDSPIGCLTLAARGGALVGLWVTGQRFFGSPYGIDEASARSALDLTSPDSREVVLAPAEWDEADAHALDAAVAWLDGYFAGEAPSPASATGASLVYLGHLKILIGGSTPPIFLSLLLNMGYSVQRQTGLPNGFRMQMRTRRGPRRP